MGADNILTADERHENTHRLAFVSAELSRAGAAVIVAPAAPEERSRQLARDIILQNGGSGANFFLVHVSTTLEYAEKTDRQGLYAKARRGEIMDFPGIGQPFEAPENVDLTANVERQSISEIVHSRSSPTARVYFVDHL